MTQYAVLTAVGTDKTGLIDEITGVLSEINVNIEDSRMSVLGGEFAVIMLLSSKTNVLNSLNQNKTAMEGATGLSINFRETIAPGKRQVRPSVPHELSAMSMDHPGIVHNITHILHKHDVNIQSLETHVDKAPVSGTPVFNMKCSIIIPVEEKVSVIRHELEELGDEMNIDMHLEAMELLYYNMAHIIPLNNEHENLGATMGPFAGWNMPIHYGSIIDETLHTRASVSIFDISHMGEFMVSEDPKHSSLGVAITVPVAKMEVNSCRYGFLLKENGAILDDLIVYRLKEDQWMLVVNAANVESDEFILGNRISSNARFENISGSIVKLDVQGPRSAEVMAQIAGPEIYGLGYYRCRRFHLYGADHIISRTGYTGELGYEIYIDADSARYLWDDLLKIESVRPAGLGARDILRVEMGYPLYGAELNDEITPSDAGLGRFIDMEKDFYGGFTLREYEPELVLTGFAVKGRRKPVPRSHILIDDTNAGYITSGVFSPHLNCGIGLGYIRTNRIHKGGTVLLDTGRKVIKADIVSPPFIKKTSIKKEF